MTATATATQCECGFQYLPDTDGSLVLDVEDHMLLQHGTRTGRYLPRNLQAVPCDSCGRKHVGERQAAKYADLDLDWALCTRCEKDT